MKRERKKAKQTSSFIFCQRLVIAYEGTEHKPEGCDPKNRRETNLLYLSKMPKSAGNEAETQEESVHELRTVSGLEYCRERMVGGMASVPKPGRCLSGCRAIQGCYRISMGRA